MLLIVLGPPAYLLAEWASARLLDSVEKLGGEDSRRLLSWRRVLVAIILSLMLISLVVLMLWSAGVNLGL